MLTLSNAIKIGEAIERYNANVKEEQHLDFYEVIECMYDESEDSIEITLFEIERRIAVLEIIKTMFTRNIISQNEYNKFLVAL